MTTAEQTNSSPELDSELLIEAPADDQDEPADKKAADKKAADKKADDKKADDKKADDKKADDKKADEQAVCTPPALREFMPLPAPEDLNAAALYLNRELTWLNFNWRVLYEAEDPRLPLLERVKFLSIVGSNLDEFFMKRIGGLKQQVGAGVNELTVDGRTPRRQIAACYRGVRLMEQRTQATLNALRVLLAEQGIQVAHYADLPIEDKAALRQYYFENIFPLVTPQAMDPAHPFPFVSNLSLNLLVTLHYPRETEPLLARVKVPVGTGIPRYLRVGEKKLFVLLEQVIANNLDLLFPGMEIDSCELFRVTRNAITELDEEQADDLLAMIETELRERKFAPVVRMEVVEGMIALHRGRLASELGLDEASDVFEVSGMLGIRDIMELCQLDMPELKEPPHHPANPPDLLSEGSVFHVIRDTGSILVHHPYESFTNSVERFLREASVDPKVRAIKMTLYRTSSDSQVIKHLIDAARNGKQVAVVLELKAKFDEEANIRWANRLEQFGIHVTYGVVGLKTHCKVILVVRQDYDGLRRYAHLGTGNYHSGTARLYSDFGLLTCDDAIGMDLTELFNYLTTGYKPRRNYAKILPAPKILKGALLEKIAREIKHQRAGKDGLIQMKMNALEDVDITRALYQASQAGVRIDLIVRDTCRLRPKLPGFSETVTIISIVGRFLEHARILYFKNGGEEEYYIGSADIMQRNLESRVETMVPVERPELQRELRNLLDIQLGDYRSAWEMRPDGSYMQRTPGKNKKSKGSQQQLMEHAEKRYKEATRLKRRKPKSIARRRLR
jgi:polyphosphate kinase